jgi:hypothetical protein
MINDNEKRIDEKIQFFLKEKIKVHINKTDKTYLNGFFISKRQEGVYVFNETKFGDIFVFLSDIYDLEEYKVVKD